MAIIDSYIILSITVLIPITISDMYPDIMGVVEILESSPDLEDLGKGETCSGLPSSISPTKKLFRGNPSLGNLKSVSEDPFKKKTI